MDGPFFSVMPFGKTGMHSLTSVTFTPHLTSYDLLPTFKCQEKNWRSLLTRKTLQIAIHVNQSQNQHGYICLEWQINI